MEEVAEPCRFALSFKQKDIKEQKQNADEDKALELLVVFAVNLALYLGFREAVELFRQLLLSRTAVINLDIGTLSGCCYLAAHLLAQP